MSPQISGFSFRFLVKPQATGTHPQRDTPITRPPRPGAEDALVKMKQQLDAQLPPLALVVCDMNEETGRGAGRKAPAVLPFDQDVFPLLVFMGIDFTTGFFSPATYANGISEYMF